MQFGDWSSDVCSSDLDPQFVLSVPKDVAADTGMDVLTHAIESYVSVMASDYTRGLSLQIGRASCRERV